MLYNSIRKTIDWEIVSELHEFIKADFSYFSFSQLYLDTVKISRVLSI